MCLIANKSLTIFIVHGWYATMVYGQVPEGKCQGSGKTNLNSKGKEIEK